MTKSKATKEIESREITIVRRVVQKSKVLDTAPNMVVTKIDDGHNISLTGVLRMNPHEAEWELSFNLTTADYITCIDYTPPFFDISAAMPAVTSDGQGVGEAFTAQMQIIQLNNVISQHGIQQRRAQDMQTAFNACIGHLLGELYRAIDSSCW